MSANCGVYLGTFVQTFGKKYYVGHNFKSLSCEVIWILALLPGVVLSQTAGPWQPMPKQLRYLHLQYARCWLWDPDAYKLNKRVSKSWLAGRINLQKGPIKLSGWNCSDLGYTFWLFPVFCIRKHSVARKDHIPRTEWFISGNYYLCYCQFYSVLSAIPPK